MKQLAEFIAEHPFFSGLAPPYVDLIAGCGQLAHYRAGDYLARVGTAADSFFLIREGKVALEITPPGRPPVPVSSVSAGEVVGWSWLFDPYRWQFDARAMDHVSAVRFDGTCLRGKCEADTALGYDLMKRFARVMVERFVDSRLQFMDVYGQPR
jgi:CRP-like cAMP-binding protein